jgi:acetyltransferase-like isoleucine patch superfamily enzyme
MSSKLKSFFTKSFYEKIETIKNKYYFFKSKLWYNKFLKNAGKNSAIINPLKISNPENIILGDNVIINQLSWLLTININKNHPPELKFDDGVNIGHFNHITCVNKVYIGKNVLTADKVYISDNIHGYNNINIPIKNQGVISKGEVYIDDNTWIGENVSIIGSKIGKHCIIGSNSVVTRDIPDFSVAVGAPAKVIKKYDKKKKKWIKL